MLAIKWLIVAGGIVTAATLGWTLRSRPRVLGLFWLALGVLPFLGPREFGLFTLPPQYLGDTHGMEVGLVDFVALTLFAARPPSLRDVRYRFALALYLAVALFSVTQAANAVPAILYSWRLLRFGLLFLAVSSGVTTMADAIALLRGMALGVLYEFYLVMHQRMYMYQSPGTFAHQNSLGMAMNLVLLAPLALVLSRKADWLLIGTPLVGLVVVLLTRSRGTLLFFLLGAVLLYALSLARSPSGRKVAVGLLAAVLALALLGRAARRITERFENAPESSMDTRAGFKKAASLMLRDHALGVGANHFGWYLSQGGYGAQAGLDRANRWAIVHNVYWLTAAELGPIGLVSLILLFAAPLVDALRYAYRAPPDDVRGELLLGLAASLLACYGQSAFEWVWRATDVSYVFWIVVGLVAALARQVLRRERRAKRRAERRRARRGRPEAEASEGDPVGSPSPEPEAV